MFIVKRWCFPNIFKDTVNFKYFILLFFFQELAGKTNEMLTEVGKVKIEMSQRLQKLESERKGQGELYDKITSLEQQLAGKK